MNQQDPNRKEVLILALSASESVPDAFTLVLEEPRSSARISITIGLNEAQSIAIHLEKMKIPRPLAHDLFGSMLHALEGNLKEICIHNIVDDIFHAWLVIADKEGKIHHLDARASDAISIGIRLEAPIFVTEKVLRMSAITETEERLSMMKGSLVHYSDEALKQLLSDVIEKEDYASAARIRDMIKKREERKR